jgi:hypothetical protein
MISLTCHEFTDDIFIFTIHVPSIYPYQLVDIPQSIVGIEAIYIKSWVDYHFTNYNLYPTVPKNRPELQSQMITMF